MGNRRTVHHEETYALIVAANSLPVRRVQHGGVDAWETSPGGLVSALVPVVQQAGGAWLGWAGDDAPVAPAFEAAGIVNVPVPIAQRELTEYYHGFCNRTLWPLYHDAVRAPEYRREWWHAYQAVNERFAARIVDLAAPGGAVWIHDYHLQLVPALVRSRRPDLRIGFYLHIPFPPEELFTRLPWRRRMIEGLLGADIVGFQTAAGPRNFRRLARRYAATRRDGDDLRHDGRRIVIGAFPISIDFARYDTAARDPKVVARADEIRRRLDGRRILLGVDRLDYSKGIDLRLEAYGELLEAGRVSTRDCVLVQVGVPSRERIPEYRDLRRTVDEMVGNLNGRFGAVGRAAVHYLRRNLPFEELVAMYRAASIMLVTPLCDGMNLVAKEFAAARVADPGVLVLSEFAGAADELRQALLVNPHDVDGLATTIEQALRMRPAEAARRMAAVRRVIRDHTVHDWAREFLGALIPERRSSHDATPARAAPRHLHSR